MVAVTVCEQLLHHLVVPPHRGVDQRREAVEVCPLGLRPALQQHAHAVRVPLSKISLNVPKISF